MARRCYATEEKEERDSFKGQLFKSTYERVLRDKAREERFAQIREAEKASRSSFGFYVPFSRSTKLSYYIGKADKS